MRNDIVSKKRGGVRTVTAITIGIIEWVLRHLKLH